MRVFCFFVFILRGFGNLFLFDYLYIPVKQKFNGRIMFENFKSKIDEISERFEILRRYL